MKLTPELAELTGILIGDGCLSKYFANFDKRWRYELAFTGNNDEYDYYRDFIQPVFKNYFNTKGRLFIRKDNSTRFHVLSKVAFDFFAGIGIPIGEKSHSVSIPREIMSTTNLLAPCLRGIWDTDGSIYQRYPKQYKNHPKHYSHLKSMHLAMVSKSVIEDVKECLTRLSIQSSEITTDDRGAFRLYITDQLEIAKYMEKVGFRNVHHLKRIFSMSA
ncbi:MAG TPA: LAGLIDADG family homing endonuclease [archaeon]|nr:LAGLIDADG family homing endonuclease [archaeon]